MGGHRTAFYSLGGRARIPGRFAIDWIRLPPGGTIEKDEGAPARNGLGAEVLAVADGVVAAAMDDIPDNAGAAAWPGAHQPQNESGNYLALDLGRGRFAFYEHLSSGSVAVKAGDRVKRGDAIARLGNSGSSSIGPHLHFHVADAGSPLEAEGVSFVFARFEDLGAFASIEALIGGETWLASPPGQAKLRNLERPRPNSVVRFP
jgi:murein DD-endopeptidase MepM/ murein hydrolase activator NlpD